jgi:hypothetical protein
VAIVGGDGARELDFVCLEKELESGMLLASSLIWYELNKGSTGTRGKDGSYLRSWTWGSSLNAKFGEQ